GEPPALELCHVEFGKIVGIREVKRFTDQAIELTVVDLIEVDQEVDGLLSAQRNEVVDVIWGRSEAHSPGQMGSLVVRKISHNPLLHYLVEAPHYLVGAAVPGPPELALISIPWSGSFKPQLTFTPASSKDSSLPNFSSLSKLSGLSKLSLL